ncbi:hypothetical protein BDR03DRAFT_937191, partial [Suillus americanus]
MLLRRMGIKSSMFLFIILLVKYFKVYILSDCFRARRLSASRELGIAVDLSFPYTHTLTCATYLRSLDDFYIP